MQLDFVGEQALPSDVVYTRNDVALDIVRWCSPKGSCLDPCCGDGAFLKWLPDGSDWCELDQGRNFFDWRQPVDWIIGNPPYSIYEEFTDHAMSLANSIVWLIPTNKLFQRRILMKKLNRWGGLRGMRIYGSGTYIGFPFGFSVGAFWMEKNYSGPVNVTLAAL